MHLESLVIVQNSTLKYLRLPYTMGAEAGLKITFHVTPVMVTGQFQLRPCSQMAARGALNFSCDCRFC
jgi:hypothetical protein